MIRSLCFRCFLFVLFAVAGFPATEMAGAQESGKSRPQAGGQGRPPSHANVVYRQGHPQNVLDLWIADSDKPTPLAVFIHGGGYRGGSKQVPAGKLEKFLSAGISVAAIEYRFVQHAKLPAAHHDCRRALQFLRSQATQWNIDPTRIGAWGGSAGAQLCMYLAFHDEMADPDSDDPIARESTRLHCISINGGQATMDLNFFVKWIPGYTRPHRSAAEYFGALSDDELKTVLADVSAIDLLSSDDPPAYMTYGMRPDDPVPEGAKARGWQIHHVVFGIKLKEKADAVGVESHLVYPGTKSAAFDSPDDFLITRLKE